MGAICPKNKHSKARRDSRRANWKMTAPNLVKCSFFPGQTTAGALAERTALLAARPVVKTFRTMNWLHNRSVLRRFSGLPSFGRPCLQILLRSYVLHNLPAEDSNNLYNLRKNTLSLH